MELELVRGEEVAFNWPCRNQTKWNFRRAAPGLLDLESLLFFFIRKYKSYPRIPCAMAWPSTQVNCPHRGTPTHTGAGTSGILVPSRRTSQRSASSRRETRPARGRNRTCRGRDKHLQPEARVRLCRRRVRLGLDAGPKPRRPRRLRAQRQAPRPLRHCKTRARKSWHSGCAKLLLAENPRQPLTHTAR